MRLRRPSWPFVIGAVALVGVIALVVANWHTFREAAALVATARPGWLALSLVAVAAGFVCAGQIYGQVLGLLGYRARQLWLVAAAMVSILLSQTIPAGTVASYTFLTTSLRRRGIPGTSVALLASLELFSWVGGMLVLFGFGLLYKVLTVGGEDIRGSYPAAMVAVGLVGGFSFAATRPLGVLHRWAELLFGAVGRLRRRPWSAEHIRRVVDELDANRRLVLERPLQMARLVLLQVLVFACHSLALLLLLRALGAALPPLAVLAAYGLALIASTFTALPGGGGTVEAALTLSLTLEGAAPEAALGATILFRLFSFWLLLPLGVFCYRRLTSWRDAPPSAAE